MWNTPLIDTHEHLCDEQDRLGAAGRAAGADDWSLVLSGYLGSDLATAGMPKDAHGKFSPPRLSPVEKWKLLEPYWPAVKNTGYGQAARISIRELYGVDDLSADTVEKVQAGYEKLRQPGFYRRVLCELGKIESCQVNSLDRPFRESEDADAADAGLQHRRHVRRPGSEAFRRAHGHHGIGAVRLAQGDRLVVRPSTAATPWPSKSQDAYRRDIDYRPAPAEKVARGLPEEDRRASRWTPTKQKALEDHLFWYAVREGHRDTTCR